MAADRYLEPHQARERASTLFEDLLGDSIERAFGEGVQTLPELVAYINRMRMARAARLLAQEVANGQRLPASTPWPGTTKKATSRP